MTASRKLADDVHPNAVAADEFAGAIARALRDAHVLPAAGD